MQKVKKILYKLYNIILDFLFPKTESQINVEKFSREEINFKISEAETLDDQIFPLFNYKEKIIKDLIWELKYKGNEKSAEIISKIMYENILDQIADLNIFENFNNPTLIPIPLSKQRMRERGFNQSEILAKKIAEMGKDYPLKCLTGVLIKIKNTGSQTKTANRKERLENLRGCFAVSNPALIKGKNLILIDDVTTTGATLKEARKTLKKAGARKIICFTIAH